MNTEFWIRLGSFAAVFVIIALWERLSPRRAFSVSRPQRWFGNLSLIAIGNLLLMMLVWLLPILAAVGMANIATDRGWGLLNYFAAPYWLKILLTVLIMDCAIYLQHVMFHAIPLLWRLHMVHHTDLDLDLTSGIRFHPLEILLSMCIKVSIVAALGAPAAGVILFEVILNATAMYTHGNLYLPRELDRLIRLLIVTPDMHRVHHSTIPNETNSNFGFNLSIWDRLFGTYRDQPIGGHTGMALGLEDYRRAEQQSLTWLLKLPFIEKPEKYPLNKRQTDE